MEDKTLNNNAQQDDNGKKKKIIIIIIAAVVIIAVVAAIVYASLGGNNTYVDIPVTEVVTDENGETVTDAQGEVVTEVVTNANGETVTQRVRRGRTTTSNTTTTTTTAPEGSNSGSVSKMPNNNGSSNQGNGNGNQNNNDDNNNDDNNGGSGNQDDNKKEDPTDAPTEKPKKRNIDISVVMPNVYGRADKLDIYVDGKLWKSDVSVKLDSKTYTFTTDDEYNGDVKIEAKLKTYGTHASATVLASNSSIKIALPLSEVEHREGIDD